MLFYLDNVWDTYKEAEKKYLLLDFPLLNLQLYRYWLYLIYTKTYFADLSDKNYMRFRDADLLLTVKWSKPALNCFLIHYMQKYLCYPL